VSSNRCGREDVEREALLSPQPLRRSREDGVEQISEPMLHGGVLERRRSGGAEISRLLTIRVAVISRIGEMETFLETDFWRFGLM
jgi:hypothetical protein